MRSTLGPTKSTGKCCSYLKSAGQMEKLHLLHLCPRSIPMDSYSSSIEQQTSLDRQELPGSMEQTSMARSQSAPMLDDEMGFPGHSNQNHPGQNQKPAIPQKAYHFDQNYNPQVSAILTLK